MNAADTAWMLASTALTGISKNGTFTSLVAGPTMSRPMISPVFEFLEPLTLISRSRTDGAGSLALGAGRNPA